MQNDIAALSIPAQRAAPYAQSMTNRETASERLVITRRDVLELLPWTVPAPGPGELRVRVDFSAVSFGDVMLRRHVFRKLPRVAVPGYEIVGTVEAAGDGAHGFAPGARVAAFIEYGGNARHALVRSRDAVFVPAGVDGASAAAALLNYATALGLFESAGLGAGDSFLIHGATGGVGSAVLDTAQSFELRALGTTRSDPGRALFGARLFDVNSPELVRDVRRATGGGVDAVFDGRAGRGLFRSRALVRSGGSLVVYGLSAVAKRDLGARLASVGSLATLALFAALPGKRTRIFALDQSYKREPERVRAWVSRALALLAQGAVAPLVGATLPLERTPEAHRLLETGQVVGKLVIDCR
jgi:NADPH:quinone reductase-like Zn-dependent oxidoreductase